MKKNILIIVWLCLFIIIVTLALKNTNIQAKDITKIEDLRLKILQENSLSLQKVSEEIEILQVKLSDKEKEKTHYIKCLNSNSTEWEVVDCNLFNKQKEDG